MCNAQHEITTDRTRSHRPAALLQNAHILQKQSRGTVHGSMIPTSRKCNASIEPGRSLPPVITE